MSEKAELFSKSASQQPKTQANQVRALLAELEILVTQIENLPRRELLAIPEMLDKVTALLDHLHEKGGRWESEQARLETIQARFRAQGGRFLKRIGGAEVLAERREEPAAWWWHIDDLVQEQRQERGRRVLFWILGIAIGVALLVLGYRQFLAPDPETVKVVGHEMDAETLVIREGDLTAALEEINAGLSYAADNPQLRIFKGVLEESLGNEEVADDVYAEAQQLMEDEEDFLVNRAERYLMVGNAEGVLTDAQRLLEINPDSARAYYFRGAVAEQREEWSTAYTNYKTASELAMESGEPDFYVFVRTRMADVMNRIETPAVSPPPGEE